MACEEIVLDLSAYLDGELPAAERGAVDAHLKECASCRAALAELKSVPLAMAEIQRHAAPASLAGEIRRQIAASATQPAKSEAEDRARQPEIGRTIRRPGSWTPLLFGVAALVALGVLLGLVLPAIARRESGGTGQTAKVDADKARSSAPAPATKPASGASAAAVDNLKAGEGEGKATAKVEDEGTAPRKRNFAGKAEHSDIAEKDARKNDAADLPLRKAGTGNKASPAEAASPAPEVRQAPDGAAQLQRQEDLARKRLDLEAEALFQRQREGERGQELAATNSDEVRRRNMAIRELTERKDGGATGEKTAPAAGGVARPEPEVSATARAKGVEYPQPPATPAPRSEPPKPAAKPLPAAPSSLADAHSPRAPAPSEGRTDKSAAESPKIADPKPSRPLAKPGEGDPFGDAPRAATPGAQAQQPSAQSATPQSRSADPPAAGGAPSKVAEAPGKTEGHGEGDCIVFASADPAALVKQLETLARESGASIRETRADYLRAQGEQPKDALKDARSLDLTIAVSADRQATLLKQIRGLQAASLGKNGRGALTGSGEAVAPRQEGHDEVRQKKEQKQSAASAPEAVDNSLGAARSVQDRAQTIDVRVYIRVQAAERR